MTRKYFFSPGKLAFFLSNSPEWFRRRLRCPLSEDRGHPFSQLQVLFSSSPLFLRSRDPVFLSPLRELSGCRKPSSFGLASFFIGLEISEGRWSFPLFLRLDVGFFLPQHANSPAPFFVYKIVCFSVSPIVLPFPVPSLPPRGCEKVAFSPSSVWLMRDTRSLPPVQVMGPHLPWPLPI